MPEKAIPPFLSAPIAKTTAHIKSYPAKMEKWLGKWECGCSFRGEKTNT